MKGVLIKSAAGSNMIDLYFHASEFIAYLMITVASKIVLFATHESRGACGGFEPGYSFEISGIFFIATAKFWFMNVFNTVFNAEMRKIFTTIYYIPFTNGFSSNINKELNVVFL